MFVDEDYLRDFTPIGQNVDISKVLVWTNEVLLTRIEPILGAYYLGRLTQRYLDSTTTPADDKVIEKIQPALAWGSAVQATINMSYKLKNKGIQKQFSDYSESAELNEILFIRDHYQQHAKVHEQRLLDFVCKNKTDYPEAFDDQNKDSQVYTNCGCEGKTTDFNDSIMII